MLFFKIISNTKINTVLNNQKQISILEFDSVPLGFLWVFEFETKRWKIKAKFFEAEAENLEGLCSKKLQGNCSPSGVCCKIVIFKNFRLNPL